MGSQSMEEWLEVSSKVSSSSASPVLHPIPVGTAPNMQVPAEVIADDVLWEQLSRDHSLTQLLHVCMLPGVYGRVIGMPDMHEGYGFPVGGVAATLAPHGVISPGGIGYDINCGVRLLRSNLRLDVAAPLLESFVHELSRSIPTGYGRHGRLWLSDAALEQVLAGGCDVLVHDEGLGTPEDLEVLESHGHLESADPAAISLRAKERGRDQLGTLGGGNHFLEVQEVETVFHAEAAKVMGLFEGQMTVMLHTGSRGLGHQVCTDAVQEMDAVSARLGYALPDRQLACAPLDSEEGRRYFAAMCGAANFAWANRQVLTQRVRGVAERVLSPLGGPSFQTVYDVAHNIAKREVHEGRELLVHRKGATRAFGPGHPDLPERYRHLGQPVFIPGSMGTRSFVLVGAGGSEARAFASCCHGAGRTLSRHAAKRQVQGYALRQVLEEQGIVVRCPSNAELAEEAPVAYKDVERVVKVVSDAGLALPVARLRPRGVLKG